MLHLCCKHIEMYGCAFSLCICFAFIEIYCIHVFCILGAYGAVVASAILANVLSGFDPCDVCACTSGMVGQFHTSWHGVGVRAPVRDNFPFGVFF